MTKASKVALQELLAKVEARTATPFDPSFEFAFYHGARDMITKVKVADSAYHGDMNAALALHNAVLPDWRWNVNNELSSETADVNWWGMRGESGRCLGNPARAWLIAILKALIWECDQ